MRVSQIRDKLEYFLVERPAHTVCTAFFNRRYIEIEGFKLYDFFNDVVITTPISPIPEQLHNPICFGNDRKLCMREKLRLNSEIVKNEEPEIFSGLWEEAYNQTH